jgi:colanic acid/amylovoran biosynthesis glycosyltransferase
MAERKPLRLLVVGASWPPQTFLGRLMRGLSESGIEVTLAFNRKPDHAWFFRSHLHSLLTRSWEGSYVTRVLWIAWLLLRALLRSPRDLAWSIRCAFREKDLAARLRSLNRFLPFAGARYDVLYFPWNSAAIDYLPLLEKGPPVLLSCRGSQINVAPHDPSRGIRDGLPLTFERAAAVHCISGAIQKEAEQFGLGPGKARLIHPGIDPDFFCPVPNREGPRLPRLITIGSLVWVKGPTYALEAIRILRDRGIPVHLTVVGDGPEKQRVLYTIEDLGLRDCVKLAGRLAPVAVRDQLRQSGIFVLPSLSEGFCNAAIEAMACALPVVMTHCGGVLEGVADGVEGFIVPVRDPTAMADAVERLINDEGLRARMGRAARERVLRQFALTKHVRSFVALLEEVRAWSVA